jgi:methyl-accepting chemotaxis protein
VVAELREGIESVAAAISSGEQRIRQVAHAAGEARGTLDGLGPGLSSALELASETASLSKSQVARITSLHDSISALSTQQDHWARGVEEIEGAVRRQTDALEDLSDAGQKLTQLTQQLRATTARVRETTHTGD